MEKVTIIPEEKTYIGYSKERTSIDSFYRRKEEEQKWHDKTIRDENWEQNLGGLYEF